MKPIRIALVDDHALVREALANALEMHADFTIVAQAASGLDALNKLAQSHADVVVLDVAMPGMNGIELAHRIRADHSRARIVALSAHAERIYVLGMLKAGAQAYVVKSGDSSELPTAIREVAENRNYLSPSIAGLLIESYVERDIATDSSAYGMLGSRERQVVQLLSEGSTSKEIAQGMHISVRTVEAHRRNIMKKLDLHSVAEITKYAVREGLTSLEA